MSSLFNLFRGSQTSVRSTIRTTTAEDSAQLALPESSGAMKTIDVVAKTNRNQTWLEGKGVWLMYLMLIFSVQASLSSLQVLSAGAAWTLTNVVHGVITFFALHWIKGVPFPFLQGKYDKLTLWEQIDEGSQYTPTKKFLTLVPIGLFILATYYSRMELVAFVINFITLAVVLIAKLPSMHGVRVFGINR